MQESCKNPIETKYQANSDRCKQSKQGKLILAYCSWCLDDVFLQKIEALKMGMLAFLRSLIRLGSPLYCHCTFCCPVAQHFIHFSRRKLAAIDNLREADRTLHCFDPFCRRLKLIHSTPLFMVRFFFLKASLPRSGLEASSSISWPRQSNLLIPVLLVGRLSKRSACEWILTSSAARKVY